MPIPKEREEQTYLLWVLSTLSDLIEEHKSTEEPIDLVISTDIKCFIQFKKIQNQLIDPDVLTKAITDELRLEGSLLRIYFIF